MAGWRNGLMTESKFKMLLAPPYVFVGFIILMTLLFAGSEALSNLLFAVIWMAIPYALARAAEKHFKAPKTFQTVWIVSAWLFCFLLLPVADALRFIGIDL